MGVHNIIRRATALALCVAFGAVSLSNVNAQAIDPDLKPSEPSRTPISSVDTSQDKYDRLVLTVEGEPFFYNGVQIRVDKTEDVWGLTDEDNRRLFQKAAEAGFTVVNSQVRWIDIQPDKAFNASEGTYIQGGSEQDSNFASEDSLKFGYKEGSDKDKQLTYLKFDYSEYPFDAVHAAKIRVHVNSDPINGETFSANLYGITNNSWEASEITWNSGAPNHSGDEVTGKNDQDYFLVAQSPSWDIISKQGYYDFDVSDFIIDHASDKTASFILQASSDGAGEKAIGASINGTDTAFPPQLVLSNEDEYDWTYLDKMLEWSEEFGLKFEIVWFGSDSTGVTMDNRVPHYILQHTKLEEIPEDGSEDHIVKFKKQDDPAYGIYWFLMDKNDLDTRKKEKKAIKSMLNHVAARDEKNENRRTLIGVDVANEPGVFQLHGNAFEPWHNPDTWGTFDDFASEQDFIDRTLWEFMINLANAVKESDYPVWTRSNDVRHVDANTVSYNEERREDGGTSLDFIGLDPYEEEERTLFKFGHEAIDINGKEKNYSAGLNLPMVMENSGAVDNAANLLLATLAGGGLYNVYDLYSSDDFGLYIPGDNDDYKNPVKRGDYVDDVIKTNNLLLKVSSDLATRRPVGAGGDKLAYLNPLLDGEIEPFKFGDVDVAYDPENEETSVGIAVAKSETELVVLSTGKATYKLNGLGGEEVQSIETGSYESGKWEVDEKVEYSEGDNSTSFNIGAYIAVRVLLQE